MILIDIYNKIKKRGIRWFIWRCRQEIYNPKFIIIKIIANKILLIKKKVKKENTKINNDFLCAIYDLEVAPITFNIGEFLCAAELKAIKLKKKGIIFICVPPKYENKFYKSEYDNAISEESKKWRLINIIIPVVNMHAACKSIVLLPDRNMVKMYLNKFEIYPELYDNFNIRYADLTELYIAKLNDFKGLKAPEQGKLYIRKYFDAMKIKNKVVTLVIRNYEYDKARNTNLIEISKFIKYLEKQGYQPIIIPDTDSAFDIQINIEDKYILRDCCWNVGLRMALYELSFINIFGPGGAGAIMLNNPECTCIMINSIVEESISSNSEAYAMAGISKGDQWSFLPKKQYISYKKETYENLVFEFEEHVKRIV